MNHQDRTWSKSSLSISTRNMKRKMELEAGKVVWETELISGGVLNSPCTTVSLKLFPAWYVNIYPCLLTTLVPPTRAFPEILLLSENRRLLRSTKPQDQGD